MSDPAVHSLEMRLVAEAAAGERDARRELFERYRDDAFRVAKRLTRRDEDAMDVVQDSFIRAFERLDRFAGDSSFKTWLLRIVTNRALDLLRSRKVRLAASLNRDDESAVEPAERAGSPRPGQQMERSETDARIRAALEQLPPDQRAVVALYASGDMTYGQIAETLGIPAGTVMSRLYHARKKLQNVLGELAEPGAD